MQYSVDIIYQYFHDLTDKQKEQFAQLHQLYVHWNAQINVISRKDIDELYVRHVLHSLGIAKFMVFNQGARILDVGTGGGFPGIPLAILYPECEFVLVDSIGKKIKVVKEVTEALGLINVKAHHQRANEAEGKFDFIVTRAVARIAKFMPWVKGKLKKEHNHDLNNGILFLKGGDLDEEIDEAGLDVERIPLKHFFGEEFFETKEVVYLPKY